MTVRARLPLPPTAAAAADVPVPLSAPADRAAATALPALVVARATVGSHVRHESAGGSSLDDDSSDGADSPKWPHRGSFVVERVRVHGWAQRQRLQGGAAAAVAATGADGGSRSQTDRCHPGCGAGGSNGGSGGSAGSRGDTSRAALGKDAQLDERGSEPAAQAILLVDDSESNRGLLKLLVEARRRTVPLARSRHHRTVRWRAADRRRARSAMDCARAGRRRRPAGRAAADRGTAHRPRVPRSQK